MAKPFKLAAPTVGEWPIARQIADVLRLELAPPGRLSRDGVLWYAIDHADFRGSVPGARLGRGVVAGIPDLFVLWGGLAFFLEIKRLPDGVLSDAQRSLCAALLLSGGRVGVCWDAPSCLACLDRWGVPRARRVTV